MIAKNSAVGPVILIGCLIAVIFVLGIGLGYYTGLGWRALHTMLGLVAIVSFFGILAIPGGWSASNGFTEGRVRLALTSALVMLYMIYFATTIFWFNTPEAQQSQLSQALFTTLSNLLMVVVPFYFGATAAAEVAKYRSRSSTEESTSQLEPK